MKHLRTATLAVGTMAACLPAHAAEPEFVPHRAAYMIKVTPHGSASRVVSGSGALALEWERDCEGVTYHQQAVMTIHNQSGRPVKSDVRINSWEAADSSLFRFLLDTRINGALQESVNGMAVRDEAGAVSVSYRSPELAPLAASAQAFFPWQQLRHVLALGRGGQRHDWHDLVRGEATGDPVRVSVQIIGPAEPPEGVEAEAGLLPDEGWSMVSAYFEDEQDAKPSFEIAETILASGVITKAKVTYERMILDIHLEKISATPLPACE